MLLHRFLVAVALCAATAATAATTACSSVAPQWSNPDPPADEGIGDGGRAPDDPPPTRRNSLEMSADTLYFLEGILPQKGADGTTAALAGPMYLRGQCHDGSMTVVVTGPAGAKKTAVRCDGRPHERALGDIEVGDTLSVAATGKAGTDFAIELVIK
jgi:hypothetical protein